MSSIGTGVSSTENPYNLGRKFKITYTIMHNYTAPLLFKLNVYYDYVYTAVQTSNNSNVNLVDQTSRLTKNKIL